MRIFNAEWMPKSVLWVAAVGLLLISTHAGAGIGVVPVRTITVASRLEGFGRVEPLSVLRLKVTLAGTVTGLHALPGERVRAGEVLARLKGPVIDGVLAQRENTVAGAEAALTAARKSLAIERQKLAEQLSAREKIAQAEAALAEAAAALGSAKARLRSARAVAALKAPVSATVLSVGATEGEPVQPGETILTLQPTGSLWLKARYYSTDAAAVRGGMQGRFYPVGGGPPVPVKVRTIIGTIEPDGGLAVGLVAMASAPGWLNGEAGTVVLEGRARTLAAVPTRALILDRGRWWVLVRTHGGTRPQAVVPGPSRGELTLIERGVAPGTEVVVDNAYLEYHRDFSRQYHPPD